MRDFRPFELPVGVRHRPTRASMSTWWREANHIRWIGGQMQPIGGWSKLDYSTPASPIRKVHVWVTNAGQKHVAYLCEEHCYVDRGDGILYDITPAGGMSGPTTVGPGGYGDAEYSLDTYGTPRPDQVRPRPLAPVYSLDNWGDHLLAMTGADGRLLRWKPEDVSGVLVAVPNAPVGNRCFVVTPERFVIVFGKDNVAHKFGWCDQENIESWTIGITSKAGNFIIQPAAPIVCAIAAGSEIMFWTTTHVYIIRYIGLPYVYAYAELGQGATPISPGSIAGISDGIIWVSESGIWRYTGHAMEPIVCEIWEWITDHIDSLNARFEAFITDLTYPTELWWFFPLKGETQNSRYAIYNYRENWFSMGQLSRSAGFSASYVDMPLLADYTTVFQHETGEVYPNSELPWIESYALNTNSGGRLTYFDRMLPDIEGNPDALNFILLMANDRVKPERQSPTKRVNAEGIVNVRETARDFRLRIESNQSVVSRWTLGQTLVDVAPRGQQ